jgi:hypothetical protein
MLNIENYGNFKTTGKQKKKKQIILCHTSREVKEYLTSLKVRYNSKYDKIPKMVQFSNYFPMTDTAIFSLTQTLIEIQSLFVWKIWVG